MASSLQEIAQLTAQIETCHRSLTALASNFLPELQTLGLPALQYAQVLSCLSSGSPSLDHLSLTPATCMSISLLTAGKTLTLSQSAKDQITNTAKTLNALDTQRKALLKDLALNLADLAPNLTALLSVEVAGELLSAVEGSLLRLSRLPASTLQSIKSPTQQNSRFGILGACDLCLEQDTQPLKIKALRLLAAKAALCARIDQERSFPNGSKGLELRQDIEARLAKLQEGRPLKEKKPLPAPIDQAIKRRGGKRAKKKKALVRQTQVRRLQNRLEFGKPEDEIIVGEEIEGLGMLTGREGKMPKADFTLRESIKKLAAKNKVYEAFKRDAGSGALEVNVASSGARGQFSGASLKSRWFNS